MAMVANRASSTMDRSCDSAVWSLSMRGSEPPKLRDFHIDHRARVALWPFAELDRVEEVVELLVEQRRLLEVDRVAGIRQHDQAGIRDGLLHQEPGLQAQPVLVAGHDQGRRRDSLHLVDTVVERWAAHLHAAQGVGRAEARMLLELLQELLEAARVLVQEPPAAA